jgi:hypothetical protein
LRGNVSGDEIELGKGLYVGKPQRVKVVLRGLEDIARISALQTVQRIFSLVLLLLLLLYDFFRLSVVVVTPKRLYSVIYPVIRAKPVVFTAVFQLLR